MRRSRPEPTPLAAAGAGGELGVLARGGLLNGAGGALGAVSTFAFAVVATRALGAAEAGVLFTVIAVGAIALALATLGTDVGLTRAVARAHALGRDVDLPRTIAVAVAPVALVGVALALGLVAAAGPLGRTIDSAHPEAGATAVRVLALALPFTAVSAALLAASRGLGTMLPSFLVDAVVRSGLRPVLALGAVAAGLGVAALAAAWAIPAAVGCIVAAVVVGRLVRRLPSSGGTAAPRAELALGFWRFSALRGIAGTMQVTLLWLDTVLLGAMASAAEAGVYTAAARYAFVGTIALQAAGMIVGPQIVRLLSTGARTRAQAVYEVSAAWLVSLSWPVYVTLALFAPVFLRLFGDGFERGETALVVLCAAMMLNTATGPVSVVLLMAGRSVANLANVAAALATNVVLDLLLIPPYGMTGAAIGWAAAIAVANLAPLWQVRRGLGLWPFGTGLTRAATVAVACYLPLGLAVRLLGGATVGSLAFAAVASTLAYGAMVYRFRHTLHLVPVRDPALAGPVATR